jgi:hypothetical protein
MSYGYIRKMSPEAVRRRKARRLKNIRIDEVSSVDVGAGHGVEVRLMKRDTGHVERKETNMSLQSLIAKSLSLRASGELSDFDLGIVHQERAKELGISLAKYYDSPEGARALKAANASHYFNMQYEGHVGNGHPAVNELDARKRNPKPVLAQPDSDDSSGDVDWNDDKQATKAYRAEKARKLRESDQSSHQDENGRRRRAVTGAGVNGKPISPQG